MGGVAGRGAPAGVLGYKWLIAGLFEISASHRTPAHGIDIASEGPVSECKDIAEDRTGRAAAAILILALINPNFINKI